MRIAMFALLIDIFPHIVTISSTFSLHSQNSEMDNKNKLDSLFCFSLGGPSALVKIIKTFYFYIYLSDVLDMIRIICY